MAEKISKEDKKLHCFEAIAVPMDTPREDVSKNQEKKYYQTEIEIILRTHEK